MADLDLEKGVLRVRQNVTTPSGKPTFGEPKTIHSKRDIPVPETLKLLLLTHHARQRAEKDKAKDAWNETGAVFATETGNYTHPDRLQKALESVVEWSDRSIFNKKRCKAVPVNARAKLEVIVRSGEKLPDLKPHDLRHTAATLMLRTRLRRVKPEPSV